MKGVIRCFEDEYEFLSNFSELGKGNEIQDDMDIFYPTVEHGFQAAKTLDPEVRKIIAALPKPNDAKKYGNNRKLVILRPDWDKKVKYEVMFDLLWKKYRIKKFRNLLLKTLDCILIEGNWWHDIDWGCCTCARCKGAGRNNLGKLTMLIREMCYNEIRLKNVIKRYNINNLISTDIVTKISLDLK